ncbi:MAG: hypothetical protein R3293_16175, partial [Candidatus Promineifilaceae bacterium]|nr:hypothetical protein [Candidatus Promineifilaceae bacterium]
MAAMNPTQVERRENPYVGPRTFTAAESSKYYGRDLEARQFIALIVANRAVLFYAPSGAGKSSLLNAKVIPGLTAEGFEVLPVGRVSGESGQTAGARNIFAYNLMASLHQDERDPADFLRVDLTYFLDNLVSKGQQFVFDDQYVYPADAELRPRVLIIDQFEEILTTNAAYWSQREDFFRQLGAALNYDDQLWLVLAMREDFIAGLDPYVVHLPDQLRNHFYMQHLDQQAALAAIQKPAAAAGRPFAEGAAEILVRNLRQIQGEDAQGEEHLAEFVEPVQLQAVCFQMWEKLRQRPGPLISAADVAAFADVDTALTNFYEDTIAATVAETGVAEIDLRNWFEYKLITEAGTRNMVFRGEEETGELPTSVADFVKSRFIVREVVRPGGIWYELVHDRFVQPVLDANHEWRLEQPVIRLAEEWDRSGRSASRLLAGGQLEHALNSNWRALGPVVAAYLMASEEAWEQQKLAEREALNAARERELVQQKALAAEEQARAEEAVAAKKRLSRWVALAIAAGIIAALFALWAGYQSIQARTNATLARIGEQAAIAAQQTAEAEAARADANFAAAATNAAVAGEALLTVQEQIMAAPIDVTPTTAVGEEQSSEPNGTNTNSSLQIEQEATGEALAYATQQSAALMQVQGTATAVANSIQELGPERARIGESVNGRPIISYRFGEGPRNVLFVGGIHYGN